MLERSGEHQGDALKQSETSHMRTHMVGKHPSKLPEVLTSFRMNVVKRASSALDRQVREAVEISRAPEGTLLNQKEEYNRCLLPRMILEGPKPMMVQEQEHRDKQEQTLTVRQEEQALLCAKKTLKAKLDSYREQKGPPGKRRRTLPKGEQPGYQLPPTWDSPVRTSLEEKRTCRSDIRTYLRPLRRCNREPAEHGGGRD